MIIQVLFNMTILNMILLSVQRFRITRSGFGFNTAVSRERIREAVSGLWAERLCVHVCATRLLGRIGSRPAGRQEAVHGGGGVWVATAMRGSTAARVSVRGFDHMR